jgi:hypothetical protein
LLFFSPLGVRAWLLYEFGLVPLEPLLALKAAKMVGFAFIRDFELRRVLVQYHAANWVSKHTLCP